MKNESKVDRRIKRTRQSLKDALISLMNEKELCSISITDIINRTDLNRSTFYSHFRDKEDLLTCIIDELMEGMIKIMQGSSANHISNQIGCRDLSNSAIQLFTYIGEHADYFKIMLNNHRVPQLTQRISETLYRFYLNEIENTLDQNTQLTINRGFFACYFTSVVLGFVHHWLVTTDMKYSPDFVAQELSKIFAAKLYIPYLQPTVL
ncbi:TetR/AcrR family transcriptional regulator [Neobacillus kokaensis]|uniref:TetR family transcriptional regulator n=1 Tax=Neobacillus kokaensis TaxID=2759023 RepID=A0ABQ3MXX8_9BACI|nr:TetR/AcrR family transcriptional regulator [Neobacillus kokaensis]GHH96766.1 TetR family transcriptional regulator [Neobacillus kokaensis]